MADLRLLHTEPLDEENFNRALAGIPHLLIGWRHEVVQVTYGWAVNLPMDNLWKPMRIQTSELSRFLKASAKDGIFLPRESDVHIEDVAGTFQFRLCHEADVHFEADDWQLIPDVLASWRALNIGVWGSPDSRKVNAPRQWTRLL